MNMLDSLMLWQEQRADSPTQVVLAWDGERREWIGAMYHGKEAEDSPMWGGAAHSIAPTPHEAVRACLEQFAVPLDPSEGWGTG